MVLKRDFLLRFKDLLKQFPAVAILGPRQCGKTTFARQFLKGWKYFDLEKPSDFTYLSQDIEAAFKELDHPFILDEAQQFPQLFPFLRGFIDERRQKNGRVVLLGSASPTLIKQISESLAGRIGFLEMTPFQWSEVKKREDNILHSRLWERGGFPKAYLAKSWKSWLDWIEFYTRSFIERDLTALGIEVDPPQMRKLWAMLAHYNGCIWNASQIASSLGVSYHTVNRYTDILEQTFLIRKLQPYYANIGKRLVKSPKIYFRDTGLLHYFLGIHQSEILKIHPARGQSWEGFIIEQVVHRLYLKYPATQIFYWRTQARGEVDLLIQQGTQLIPIEIKLHSSPTRNDMRSLWICMDDLKLKVGYVLYPGKRSYSLGNGVIALPIEKFLNEFPL